MRFISIKDVRKETALCTSSVYSLIKEGLFPPPFRVGIRRVAWTVEEIEAWKKAAIRGASDDERRALVAAMVEARRQGVDA